MNRRCLVLWSLVLAAMVAPTIVARLGDRGALDPAERADVVQAVTRFLQDYQQPLPAAEPERLRRWFHDGPGLAWCEDGAERYRSLTAMGGALAAMPPGAVFRTALTDPTVDPLTRDLCAVRSRFATRIDGLGAEVSYSGVLTMVLQRRDGRWAIRSGHASSDRDARPR
ncbi:MAG: DUF4440 domain-containing protein [Planctomycetota bacterium]